ncbi:MAG: hypothetical protein HY078_13610 [Elusimicrobia bacterium]|nr:hypothetical protein [Elusimicrobiota bacterium]
MRDYRALLTNCLRGFGWLSVAVFSVMVILALFPDSRGGGDADLVVSSAAPVPPKENSYDDILALKKSLALSSEELSQAGRCIEDAACKTDALAPVFARNADALRRFDALRGKRLLPPDWADIATVDYRTPVPAFSPVTQASALAIAEARYLVSKGRRAEALERLVRIAEVGRSLQTEPVSLLPYMLGLSIRSRALKAARGILDGKPWLSAAAAKDAAARLGDPDAGRAGLTRAARMEYSIAANTIARLGPGQLGGFEESGRFVNWVASRYFKRNRTRRLMADDFRGMIRKIDLPCPPLPIEPPRPRLWTHPEMLRGNLVGLILHQIGSPNWDNTLRRRCEESFWTAATSVSIAGRAFSADAGRGPRSLAELVPRYLPRVPDDPFTGKPLELSPDGGLASAGSDVQGKPIKAGAP